MSVIERIGIDGKLVPFPEEHKHGSTGRNAWLPANHERRESRNRRPKDRDLEVIVLPRATYKIRREFVGPLGVRRFVVSNAGVVLAEAEDQRNAHFEIKKHHGALERGERVLGEVRSV